MSCPQNQTLNPERYKNTCGGCGRPVPAPCPYCQTCHCSLNCSLVTAGKRSNVNWKIVNKNKWLSIIAIALCILLTVVIITLIICVWYYSDRWAGAKGKDETEEESSPEIIEKTTDLIGPDKNEDYNEYQYIR